MHVEYVPRPHGCPNGYDIALMKLERAIQFNDNVKVALPGMPPNPDINTELKTAGWGRTDPVDSGSKPDRMKWVNQTCCMLVYVFIRYIDTDKTDCDKVPH